MVQQQSGPVVANRASSRKLEGSELDMMEVDKPECRQRNIDEMLPEAMLMEVLSRLPDARDLARCAAVNHFFRVSSTQVRAVRFTCRQANMFPRQGGKVMTPFKDSVNSLLGQLNGVEDLRLEIEEKIQGKRYKQDELDKTSLWLSERSFVSSWVPMVSKTLQHLCLIDYGQQAIFKPSPLLQTLSSVCPNLQTIEVRNMYLDCRDCQIMPKMKSVTLRCVKLSEAGLKDINRCMPNLAFLALVTVVGLKEAELKSDSLEVLCLGLATKVNSVKLESNSLNRLQLKMQCPEKLKVISPNLQSLALCMGQNRTLEFEKVSQLKELLVGASEFSTLARLSATNSALGKVFLDIPCMSFEEGGKWKGVLPQVPLNVPDMEAIRKFCPRLETMSVGPGLWYSLEKSMTNRDSNGDLVLPKWPTLKRLILHIVVANFDSSLGLLTALIKAIPTLTVLEVYVHESSKVQAEEFCQHLQPVCSPMPELKVDTWLKGLKFGCFSF
ncbi:unnamed protein product [Calypogeia fissa]